jgi:hypothetical protein
VVEDLTYALQAQNHPAAAAAVNPHLHLLLLLLLHPQGAVPVACTPAEPPLLLLAAAALDCHAG